MSEKHKQIAKKALGQHFLISQKAIRLISEAVPEGASLIEIGPGPGAITEPLLERAGQVSVIEKDDRFAEHWQQRSDRREGLSVVHGDVLELLEATISEYRPEWIVGNLPYNISGPLTAQLASHALCGGMILMYQREVGERIMAGPGSKVYGGLSVLVRHHYSVKRLLTLPPGAFSPPPKVHSVVLLLTAHNRVPACEFNALQKMVRRGFRHRRKTITNNMKELLTANQLEAIGINPKHRPEQLDYSAWVAMTLAAASYSSPHLIIT